jgi:hypothetical protein
VAVERGVEIALRDDLREPARELGEVLGYRPEDPVGGEEEGAAVPEVLAGGEVLLGGLARGLFDEAADAPAAARPIAAAVFRPTGSPRRFSGGSPGSASLIFGARSRATTARTRAGSASRLARS